MHLHLFIPVLTGYDKDERFEDYRRKHPGSAMQTWGSMSIDRYRRGKG